MWTPPRCRCQRLTGALQRHCRRTVDGDLTFSDSGMGGVVNFPLTAC
jgi:hypothetical protein